MSIELEVLVDGKKANSTVDRLRAKLRGLDNVNDIKLKVNADEAQKKIDKLGQSTTSFKEGLKGNKAEVATGTATANVQKLGREVDKVKNALRRPTNFTADGLDKASGQLQTYSRSVSEFSSVTEKASKSTGGLTNTLLKVTVASGAAASLAIFSDILTNIDTKINLVTNSTTKFANAFRDVTHIATATRTPLADIATLYTKIAQASDTLGVSQREVARVTSTIGKSLAVSGTTMQEARSAILQLGQGLASGILAGEELRSVLENAPALARAIAEGMGKAIGDLRKMGEEGKLTADEVFRAILSQADVMDSKFKKVGVTFAQAFQNAQTSGLLLFRAISNLFFSSSGGPAEQINNMAVAMGKFAERIQHYASVFEIAIIDLMLDTIKFIQDLPAIARNAFEAIKGMMNGLFDFEQYKTKFKELLTFLPDLSSVKMWAAKVVAVFVAAGVLIGGVFKDIFGGLSSSIDKITTSFSKTLTTIRAYLKDLKSRSAVEKVPEKIGRGPGRVYSDSEMSDRRGFTMVGVNSGVRTVGLNGAQGQKETPFLSFMDAVKSNYAELVDVMKSIKSYFSQKFSSVMDSLLSTSIGRYVSMFIADFKDWFAKSDAAFIHTLKQVLGIQDKVKFKYEKLGRMVDSDPDGQVARGPKKGRESRAFGHDAFNALPSSFQVPVFAALATMVGTALHLLSKKLIPIFGEKLPMFTFGVYTTVLLLYMEKILDKQLVADASKRLVGGFREFVDMIVKGFLGKGITGSAGLIGTLTVIAKLALLFEKGREIALGALKTIATGPTRLAQIGTDKITQQVLQNRLANADLRIANARQSNPADLAAATANRQAVNTQLKDLNKTLAEASKNAKAGLMTLGGGIGGTAGTFAGYQIGVEIVKGMGESSEWAKYGTIIASALTGQAIGAFIGVAAIQLTALFSSAILAGVGKAVAFLLPILTAPITLFIVGVAALVLALTNWDTLVGAVKTAFTFVKENALDPFVNKMGELWENVSKKIKEHIDALTNGPRSFVRDTLKTDTKIPGTDSTVGDLGSFVGGGLIGTWVAVKLLATQLGTTTLSSLSSMGVSLRMIFQNIGPLLNGLFLELAKELRQAFGITSPIVRNLITTLGIALGAVAAVFSSPAVIAAAVIAAKLAVAAGIGYLIYKALRYASGTDLPQQTESAKVNQIPANAAGGPIRGPGTGTSDSILARLSNGEFVVNAAATARHRGLLETINNGGLPGFAKGGYNSFYQNDRMAAKLPNGKQKYAPETTSFDPRALAMAISAARQNGVAISAEDAKALFTNALTENRLDYGVNLLEGKVGSVLERGVKPEFVEPLVQASIKKYGDLILPSMIPSIRNLWSKASVSDADPYGAQLLVEEAMSLIGVNPLGPPQRRYRRDFDLPFAQDIAGKLGVSNLIRKSLGAFGDIHELDSFSSALSYIDDGRNTLDSLHTFKANTYLFHTLLKMRESRKSSIADTILSGRTNGNGSVRDSDGRLIASSSNHVRKNLAVDNAANADLFNYFEKLHIFGTLDARDRMLRGFQTGGFIDFDSLYGGLNSDVKGAGLKRLLSGDAFEGGYSFGDKMIAYPKFGNKGSQLENELKYIIGRHEFGHHELLSNRKALGMSNYIADASSRIGGARIDEEYLAYMHTIANAPFPISSDGKSFMALAMRAYISNLTQETAGESKFLDDAWDFADDATFNGSKNPFSIMSIAMSDEMVRLMADKGPMSQTLRHAAGALMLGTKYRDLVPAQYNPDPSIYGKPQHFEDNPRYKAPKFRQTKFKTPFDFFEWMLRGNEGKDPEGYAAGGSIRGAGTGTSDSILARLSNGEFVVNAKSTAKYQGLLEAINSGAGLPGFSEGGKALFERTYRTSAERVGNTLGVSPDVILRHWGLETGYGAKIVGNNLGNMIAVGNQPFVTRSDKDAKGNPIKQNFRVFKDIIEFEEEYSGLIQRRYKESLNAEADMVKFATGLQKGGYAEDPAYVEKFIGRRLGPKEIEGMVPSSGGSLTDRALAAFNKVIDSMGLGGIRDRILNAIRSAFGKTADESSNAIRDAMGNMELDKANGVIQDALESTGFTTSIEKIAALGDAERSELVDTLDKYTKIRDKVVAYRTAEAGYAAETSEARREILGKVRDEAAKALQPFGGIFGATEFLRKGGPRIDDILNANASPKDALVPNETKGGFSKKLDSMNFSEAVIQTFAGRGDSEFREMLNGFTKEVADGLDEWTEQSIEYHLNRFEEARNAIDAEEAKPGGGDKRIISLNMRKQKSAEKTVGPQIAKAVGESLANIKWGVFIKPEARNLGISLASEFTSQLSQSMSEVFKGNKNWFDGPESLIRGMFNNFTNRIIEVSVDSFVKAFMKGTIEGFIARYMANQAQSFTNIGRIFESKQGPGYEGIGGYFKGIKDNFNEFILGGKNSTTDGSEATDLLQKNLKNLGAVLPDSAGSLTESLQSTPIALKEVVDSGNTIRSKLFSAENKVSEQMSAVNLDAQAKVLDAAANTNAGVLNDNNNFFFSSLSSAWRDLGGILKSAWGDLKSILTSAWDIIKGIFTGGSTAPGGGGLLGGIGGLISGAKEWFTGDTAGGTAAGAAVSTPIAPPDMIIEIPEWQWDFGYGMASGGRVSGAGTGTSDSIATMLSNGEYVINANSTKKFLPLLESINNGSFRRFAEGGLVAGALAVTPAMASIDSSKRMDEQKSQQVFNINITGDVSRQTRSEIQKMIPQIATGVNMHNAEKGRR
jgi:tape measure domain-containing protein